MKNWSAGEVVIVILALSIAAAIIMAVYGSVFRGSATPNEGSAQTRLAMTDLLKFVAGAILGSVATMLAKNK